MIELKGSGCPSTLTDEVHARIIAAVPEVLIQNQIAALARVPAQNLSYWLKRGKQEHEKGISSIYTKLLDDYRATKAAHLKKLLVEIQSCKANYGALTWTLEKCFREDFGAESEEMRQLKALFAQVLPMLGKGAAFNGESEKVDSESNS